MFLNYIYHITREMLYGSFSQDQFFCRISKKNIMLIQVLCKLNVFERSFRMQNKTIKTKNLPFSGCQGSQAPRIDQAFAAPSAARGSQSGPPRHWEASFHNWAHIFYLVRGLCTVIFFSSLHLCFLWNPRSGHQRGSAFPNRVSKQTSKGRWAPPPFIS